MKYRTVDLERIRAAYRADFEAGEVISLQTGRPLKPDVGRSGRKVITVCGVSIGVHRVLWALYYEEWPKGDIDHINNDAGDNRIENLRIATNQQNQYNTKSRQGTSRFKGVSWRADEKCWQVRIAIDGKLKHLGRFKCEKAAARAYDEAARRHHGEYARLNFEVA